MAKVIDKDFGFKRIKQRWKDIAGDPTIVLIGIQGTAAKEPKPKGGNISNVEVAAVHEFGTKDGRIPERSFLRSTFDENERSYQKKWNEVASRVFNDPRAKPLAFKAVGDIYRTDIVKKITSGIPPPLKQATIDAKGGDETPLIDIGQLRNSIETVIEGTQ